MLIKNLKKSKKIQNVTKMEKLQTSDNSFVQAILRKDLYDTTTTNGMASMSTTHSELLNLFGSLASFRNCDILPSFKKAFKENPILAIKLALYLRDCREGQGNRQNFRDIIGYLTSIYPYNVKSESKDYILKVINKIPELGRWDDLFYIDASYKDYVFELIKKGLNNKETAGLCAKWMPRQGALAKELGNYMNLSSKNWRKFVVNLSNTVEQQMCANEWNNIEYSKVPSIAFKNYSNAFTKHDKNRFNQFLINVKEGKEKINASVIYPYQVIDNLENNIQAAEMQWLNLPDFIPEDSNILVMCDDSGSMTDRIANTTCLNVAHSLAIYTAERLKSAFKGLFLTFSETPRWMNLNKYKTLTEKINYCRLHSEVANTNIEAALDLILDTAIKNNVKPEDMPKSLLILSDMQFDYATTDDSLSFMEMMKDKYRRSGYVTPQIIFWNLYDNSNNFPVAYDEKGVALISGFSPSIFKYLKEDLTNPFELMLKILNNERYNIE